MAARGNGELTEWEHCHAPTAAGGVPSRLFSDEDPATTVKGLGFRDPATARATIELAGQPGSKYKQYALCPLVHSGGTCIQWANRRLV